MGQKLETLIDYPPFENNGKKAEKSKQDLIESTDDFLVPNLSDKDNIVPNDTIEESKKESFKIQTQNELESTVDFPMAIMKRKISKKKANVQQFKKKDAQLA